MGVAIARGRIFLGRETLRCPRCRRTVHVDIHTDLPDRDWVACSCGYRAVLHLRPFLDRYGVPPDASKPERRETGDHLQREIAKI